MHLANFVVLPELEACLPGLTKDEQQTLEQSIFKDGVLTPLIVCKIKDIKDYVLLDGHHRYKIANQHNLAYFVDSDKEPLSFDCIEDAVAWTVKHQLGRRNLTALQRESFVGEQYNLEKARHGGSRSKSSRQSEDLTRTSDKVAKTYKMSPSTVERSGKKAKYLESTGLKEAVQRGQITHATQSVLKQIDDQIKESPDKKEEIIKGAVESARQNKGRLTDSRKTSKAPVADPVQPPKAELLELEYEVSCQIILRTGMDENQLREFIEEVGNWKFRNEGLTLTQIMVVATNSIESESIPEW